MISRAGSPRTVRAYSATSGETAGSIIAAIITVQMPTNAGSPSPIVPGSAPMPMSTAHTMVAIHAATPTARTATITAETGRGRASATGAATDQAAQENGAAKPLRPSPDQSMPNNDERTPSPGVTVSVGPAGWTTIPVSVTGSEASGPRAIVPPNSLSAPTRRCQPSESCSRPTGARSVPRTSVINGESAANGPPTSPVNTFDRP